ncbi:MAG: ParB/RepB/Spo0J family partition protein [Oscillospiraceae bacterium]|nr:ParB/RepB/Spo0J family partition protein [Oscillospiraceae bacterium]
MAAKEKKGLGTGLDVLFAANELEEPEGELLTLPISKVEPREAQPRKRFDEEALQELADSIARYGLIQPIVARKLDSGYYQIIAGERRWRASRMAGLTEVPVRVLEADDRRTAELALVENLQREDLNPIEEARGYRTLMEDYGLTQEETARSVGRSRPAVANALRLLSLSPAVMELVEKRQLSAGHARAILPLPGEKQQLELAREVLKKSLTVRRTEQLVARMGKAGAAGGQKEDPLAVNYAAEVAEELSRLLGRKVRLLEARRGGRIELDYYDPEDRERLIEALRGLAGRKDK